MGDRTPAGDSPLHHPTPEERAARGKDAREKVPRDLHGVWDPAAGRPDPVDLFEEQATTRVPELVPIRYGRMLASAFAYYRGAAYSMAADLSTTASSGIRAQLCGDAHLSNFGGFAAPDRDLVFDINDFDESLRGPWEWDVKRLAASVAIAGRERGFSKQERRTAVLQTARQYRTAMREFAGMGNLMVWYTRLDSTGILDRWEREAGSKQVRTFEKTVERARAKDSTRAFAKLATTAGGEPRIRSDPPLIVPIDELVGDESRPRIEEWLHGLLRTYRRSLSGDRRHLLESFRFVDMARKVVGVGSVGTRAWIGLLLGRDGEDPLFLQFKQAEPSVLARFVGRSRFANQGQRVVEGQRLMQATSDIFLGWDRAAGVDGVTRDFYVRQLWDQKASVDVGRMAPPGLNIYGQICGWTLARAHARSGDRIAIATYLGGSSVFDKAIADFAESYADQNERDFVAFEEAVKAGRIVAQTGT